MNAIARSDPSKEMEELQNRLSSFFGRTPARMGDRKDESITVAEWAPLVDITEDDKEYLIKIELPEIKKEDVKVALENGVLTITGERKFERNIASIHAYLSGIARRAGIDFFPHHVSSPGLSRAAQESGAF
jgi:HSP20 family molecular chaperone IbpA